MRRAALILALVALAPAPARAEEADAEKAARLFDEGQDAKAKGELATACSKFAESFAIGKSAGPLLNQADCEERRGRLATALALWKKGLELLEAAKDPADTRGAFVQGRIAALDPRVPRVTPTASPGAARVKVTLDGKQEIPVAVAALVDPGDHVLVVSAAGHADRTIALTVAPGERHAPPVGAGPAVVPLPPAPPPSRGMSSGGVTAVGAVALGVGVSGLAVFGVTGALVVDKDAKLAAACPNKVCTDPALVDVAAEGRTLLGVNSVAVGIGAAGVIVGTAVLAAQAASRSKREVPKPVTLQPALEAGPGRASIGIRGRF